MLFRTVGKAPFQQVMILAHGLDPSCGNSRLGRRSLPPSRLSANVQTLTQGSVDRARGLDDRRPAVDFALYQRGECLLPAAALVRQHAPELEQPLARPLVVQRLVERVAELVENRLRRALRGEQGIPCLRLEFRQSPFLAGRDV